MQSSLVLINNLAARIRLAPEAFKAGSKVWDGWGRSIEDAWYASPNQRVAQYPQSLNGLARGHRQVSES